MRPISCPETPNPQRKLWCKSYERCLDMAVSKAWLGFHCLECHEYESSEWDREWFKADAIACMALALAVFNPKAYRHIRPATIARFLEGEARREQDVSL